MPSPSISTNTPVTVSTSITNSDADNTAETKTGKLRGFIVSIPAKLKTFMGGLKDLAVSAKNFLVSTAKAIGNRVISGANIVKNFASDKYNSIKEKLISDKEAENKLDDKSSKNKDEAIGVPVTREENIENPGDTTDSAALGEAKGELEEIPNEISDSGSNKENTE